MSLAYSSVSSERMRSLGMDVLYYACMGIPMGIKSKELCWNAQLFALGLL
jgi:hypothetical protein